MIVLDAVVMGLGGEMLWFIVTAILVVLVIGGGMVLAVRSYSPHRRR